MRVSKRASVAAISAAVVLAAAACSGGGDTDDSATAEKTANGAIVVDGSQPEVGLIPANTTETGGGDIIDYMWSGWSVTTTRPASRATWSRSRSKRPTPRSTRSRSRRARSSTTAPRCKAKNFVDAWNWAAYSPNGAQNSSFFSDIAGFADVQSRGPGRATARRRRRRRRPTRCPASRSSTTHTFKVTLAAPFSIFPVKLGYSAFVPLPDAFFTATPRAFGKKPIGNGPVKFVSWQDNVEIKLTRFDDYTLARQGQDQGRHGQALPGPGRGLRRPARPTTWTSSRRFRRRRWPARSGRPTWATRGDRRRRCRRRGIIAFPMYDAQVQERRPAQGDLDGDQPGGDHREDLLQHPRRRRRRGSNPLAPGDEARATAPPASSTPTEAKALLAKAGGFKGEMVLLLQRRRRPQGVDGGGRAERQEHPWHRRASPRACPTFAVFRQQINAHKMDGPVPRRLAGRTTRTWRTGSARCTSRAVRRTTACTPTRRSTPLQGGHLGRRPGGRARQVRRGDEDDRRRHPVDADLLRWPSSPAISNKVKNVQITSVGELDLSSVEIA